MFLCVCIPQDYHGDHPAEAWVWTENGGYQQWRVFNRENDDKMYVF